MGGDGDGGAIQQDPLDRAAFVAFAKKVFLAYHRALATGDTAPVRPYLDVQLRRRVDTGRAGSTPFGARATDEYAATRLKVARILSAERNGSTDRVTIRFGAAIDEVPGGVVAEEWTFERPVEVAQRIADGSLEKCPTCGAPLSRRARICGYCDTPMVGGGWRVVAIKQVDTAALAAPVPRAAIIAGAVLACALVGVVAALVIGSSGQIGDGSAGTTTVASREASSQSGGGLTGVAALEINGALVGSASGDAEVETAYPSHSTSCSASALDVTGISFTASHFGDRAARVMLTASVPPGSIGPGERRGNATVAYEEVTADGRRVTQSWVPIGHGSVTITITSEANVFVVFSNLAPRGTSVDPQLNQPVSGTLTFTCAS
ncbi:MAG: zinc-ribbon domain-containing transport protein [Acidimicrobiales bacterium]|nr:zinc-ribbon domain-containing transport protein [Acidimicrobiales bacterium]